MSQVIRVKCTEGQVFELTVEAASLSEVLSDAFDPDEYMDSSGEDTTPIDVTKIRAACLQNVIDYLTHYQQDPMTEITTPLDGDTLQEIIKQDWYRRFIETIDLSMVFQLVTAANYLNIKSLLDLAILRVSIELMGKPVDEIHKILNIPQMTEEEKIQAMEDYKWLFSDSD
jgi:S-phase kinase-associated protein 1